MTLIVKKHPNEIEKKPNVILNFSIPDQQETNDPGVHVTRVPVNRAIELPVFIFNNIRISTLAFLYPSFSDPARYTSEFYICSRRSESGTDPSESDPG